jgi:acyl dehydratase
MSAAPAAASAAKVRAFSSLYEGQSAAMTLTVTEDDMAAFAALSGDYNPLHVDAAFASAQGFAGRVVYGALLLAKISTMIGMELPGRDSLWTGVQMQFVSPLVVGDTATLDATVVQVSAATRSIELKLHIRCDERVIARGKASVSIRDGG